MRSLADRIRHTILFEVIAIPLFALVGGWILGLPVEVTGALGLMFSALAMAWNLLFNWLFDLWDRKYRGMAKRGFAVRAVHACLFELGLLIAGLFLIAWWLEVGYLEAFLIDISSSAFFLVYAFVYNWAYDQVFPPPRPAESD